MRHQKKIKKLGRTAAHRKATLAAMSSALIEHKRIETTLPKAKALRSFVEPIINRAKDDSTASRRQAFRYLRNKEAVKELFGDIAAHVGDRPGGYTRVVKLGLRQGDGAEMAVIELVDYNDVQPEGGTSGRKRTRRSSGGGRRRSKKGAQQQSAPVGDSLTKIHGVGKAFAEALDDAGLTTYAAVANADLETLRRAIAKGSEGAEAIANEETWAEQARLLAAGDKEAHEAYVDQLREADAGSAPAGAEAQPEAPAAETAEPEASADEAADTPDAGDASGTAASAVDAPEAEAPAADDASTQSDDAPVTPSDEDTMHGDTPQGSAPGTGEPPPESGEGDKGTAGGSQHRG
jgi:large subunit ribosomal protein L17